MSDERLSDRQLELLGRTADGLEVIIEQTGSGNLHGARVYLRGLVKDELAARDRDFAARFVSPAAQLDNLRRWNVERNWGFADAEFERLGPPPRVPEGLPFATPLLEAHLPDEEDRGSFQRTFERWLALLLTESPVAVRVAPDLKTDPKLLMPVPGSAQPPGLRWRLIDLGARWSPSSERAHACGPRSSAPHCLADPSRRVGTGLLMAACHFPVWFRIMNGKRVPYVWLSGCDAEVPGKVSAFSSRERIVYHPLITNADACTDAKLLYYGWDYVSYSCYAVPEYLD